MYDQLRKPIYKLYKTQLIFRCISLIILLFWFISEFIVKENAYQLVAFTIWGLIASILSFMLLILHSYNRKRKKTWYHQWLWRTALLLFETAIVWEIVITIVFWSILYKDVKSFIFGGIDDFNMHFDHIFPVVFLLIEFSTNKYLFRLQHWIIVVFLGSIYAAFNWVYVLTTGKRIYPILTWKDAMTAVWVVALFFGMILTFFILYKISIWKRSPKDYLKSTQSTKKEPSLLTQDKEPTEEIPLSV